MEARMAERLSDYLRSLPKKKVIVVAKENFAEVIVEAHRSIQSGSEITGAPGQPVQTGALRNSWMFEFLSEFRARITSPILYALPIEDGISRFGEMTVRSATGGFHSVKLTIAGAQRIVDAVAARRRGTAP
jgi:hypothetical protein